MSFSGTRTAAVRQWARKALLGAALLLMPGLLRAQQATTAELIQGHSFVFIADWATSNSGFRRQLIPTYELVLTSDSVYGRLPFYGRVYSPADAYKMTTEGFTISGRVLRYDLRKKRKGRSQLVLEVRSGNNVQKLTFDIFDDGSARLFINSAWRDAMSYDGRIAGSQSP